MNSYPSLVPRYAAKYHSGISAPSGLKQYCYKCFCVRLSPNDCIKVNLMIRKFIHSDILKLHVNNSCTFVTNST